MPFRVVAALLLAYVGVGPWVELGPTAPRWALLLLDHERLYVLALALPLLAFAARRRDRVLGALCVAPALGWLLVVARDVTPRAPVATCGAPVRIASANLLMVNPDPTALAAELAAVDVDALLLQEYSPRWAQALAPLRARYPYGAEVVREDSFGSAIYAREPLESGIFDLAGLPQTKAVLSIGGRPVDLWNVHTLPPRTPEYIAPYLDGLDTVASFMELSAEAGRSFLVTGDMNATPTSRFAGRVRGWPWRPGPAADAWELVGGGFGFTWPNGLFPLPPSRLDHVFLSHDLTVTSIRVGVGAHSDHRPLFVTVARAGGCGAAED